MTLKLNSRLRGGGVNGKFLLAYQSFLIISVIFSVIALSKFSKMMLTLKQEAKVNLMMRRWKQFVSLQGFLSSFARNVTNFLHTFLRKLWDFLSNYCKDKNNNFSCASCSHTFPRDLSFVLWKFIQKTHK